MTNLFIVGKIEKAGGIETSLYYISKKYGDIDITVVYRQADYAQLARLKKRVRCVKFNGSKLSCDKAFFNYDLSMLPYVEANKRIQLIHADYLLQEALPPSIDERIDLYLAVTRTAGEHFKQVTGLDYELCYNCFCPDEPRDCKLIIAATRLGPEKSPEAINLLSDTLDLMGKSYILLVFSPTDPDGRVDIRGNVAIIPSNLNIIDYINKADIIYNPSRTEAYCYTVVEALNCKKPVMIMDLDVYRELGANENNAIFLKKDFSNIKECIEKLYSKEFDFEYEPKQDCLDKYLTHTKNEYVEEIQKMVKVKCIIQFNDDDKKGQNKLRLVGEEFETTLERANYFANITPNPYDEKYVEILGEVEESKEEPKTVEEPKEEATEEIEVVEEKVEEPKENKKANKKSKNKK